MFPFRPGWRRAWPAGLACVVLFPVGLPLLSGYAIRAIRSSRRDPASGPPGWALTPGLLADGVRAAGMVALISAPFALAFWPLSLTLFSLREANLGHDAFLDRAYALLGALVVLALPWGLAMLLLAPAGLSAYARSGRARDLLDLGAAARMVREQFGAWNLAVATIVTAWALGLACGGLLCLGIIPGAFYAILVSAHATARLDPVPAPAAANSPPR